MGVTTASYGIVGGLMLITTPQLLSANGTPETAIAWVTGIGILPGSIAFLLSPMLDLRLARRTWASLFAIVAAVFMFAALSSLKHIAALGGLLFVSNFAATLFLGAQTGWLGELIGRRDQSRLAAWSTVGNIGGGGVIAMIAIPALRALPTGVGAAGLSLLIVAPILPFVWLPAPAPDPGLSRGGWRALRRDLRGLVAQPSVRQVVVLFASPAAAFALAYTLGGLGAAFHASERFVGLVGGAGVLLGAGFGSLLVPPLAQRIPAQRLYLLIGAAGAMFTLGLLVLPRTPTTFAFAMIGENVFQAAAFTTSFTIGFRSLGANNPLAATQMSLFTAASTLPIAYMQVLDGQAYGLRGVAGALLFDSLVSLICCGVLFFLLSRRLAVAPAATS